MKNKKLIVIIAIIIVIAGAVTALFVSGRLVWTNPNGLTNTAKSVCNSDLVDSYNKAMYFTPRGDSKVPTLDKEGLKKIESDINDSKGYKDDPTCQTILFWLAVNDKNYENAKTAYEAVKAMHTKGIFADSNLRNNQPLFSYESVVASLSPEVNGSTNEGKGDAN